MTQQDGDGNQRNVNRRRDHHPVQSSSGPVKRAVNCFFCSIITKR